MSMTVTEAPTRGRLSHWRKLATSSEYRKAAHTANYEQDKAELLALDQKRAQAIVSGVNVYLNKLPSSTSSPDTHFPFQMDGKPYIGVKIIDVPPGHSTKQTRGFRFHESQADIPKELVAEKSDNWAGSGVRAYVESTSYVLTRPTPQGDMRMTAIISDSAEPDLKFELRKKLRWSRVDPRSDGNVIDRALGIK